MANEWNGGNVSWNRRIQYVVELYVLDSVDPKCTIIQHFRSRIRMAGRPIYSTTMEAYSGRIVHTPTHASVLVCADRIEREREGEKKKRTKWK